MLSFNMMQTYPPFIRYAIQRSINSYWWDRQARSYLEGKGWTLINPGEFIYEESYGWEPTPPAPGQLQNLQHALHNAGIILEYRGEPDWESAFEIPSQMSTIVDDLLAYISIYSGVYWQYLWKEWRTKDAPWQASVAMQVNFGHNSLIWAGDDIKAFEHFEIARTTIPRLDKKQFDLANNWSVTALRELETGRPLVEAALNWVILESQANYWGLVGPKAHKRIRVETLLNNQGFPSIPRLKDFYQLRNDAFHDGQLSNLSETDAQAARTAGRALARAQILNLLGMQHSDFRQEFVDLYAK